MTKQPKGQRIPDLIAWAREILDEYPDAEGSLVHVYDATVWPNYVNLPTSQGASHE